MRSVFLSVVVLAAGCNFLVAGLAADGTAGGPDMAVAADLAMSMPPADAAGLDLTTVSMPPDMAKRARRKSITVDNSKVNGNQTNFPVWIDLTDADVAARAAADGHDLFFTASDGATKLDFQIQRWDAASHKLNAWVRVPSLPASAPTVLYLYYGDPTTTATQNPAGVFSSGFAAVWHLEDAANSTTIADATGTHAGTPNLTTTTQGAAKLGGGLTFTGGNDTITFTNPLGGNQAHTISVWVNQQATTHASAILVVGPTGTPMQGQSRWFYGHFSAAVMAIGFYSDDWTTNTNLDGAGWSLVHWVFEGPNGRNRIYVNGVEIAGSPQTLNGINTQGASGVIGHAPEPAYGTNMGLVGSIDELRIATVARSPGWVATEYANQSAPATFYAVGAEELAP